MPTKKKQEKPDAGTTARRVARKVVGIVKAARAIDPDPRKKKPKHKPDPLREAES
ncbi:MAG TPA: hypothetical protein VFQ91_00205 [Bryobacteraceae bacterium]|nr:hypothetical protein [Bryobacteraceae bacterium]